MHLEPLPGTLLFFPGWLTHRVTTHECDSQRVSLAFNIRVQSEGDTVPFQSLGKGKLRFCEQMGPEPSPDPQASSFWRESCPSVRLHYGHLQSSPCTLEPPPRAPPPLDRLSPR